MNLKTLSAILVVVAVVLGLLFWYLFVGAPTSDQTSETNQFLKQWEETAKAKGNEFSYASVESQPDGSFALKSVVIEDKKEAFTINVDELAFTDPEALGENGIRFGGMQAKGFQQKGTGENDGDYVITAANVNATAFDLPNVSDRENPLWPANIGSLELDDVLITTEENDQTVSISAPGLNLNGLQAKSGTNFLLEGMKMEPATVSLKKENDDTMLDIGFDGLRVKGVEHFGTAGLEVEDFEFGKVVVTGKDDENRAIDIKFGGISAQNLYVADPAEPFRPLVSEKPMKMDIRELSATMEGKEFAGWKGGTANYRFDPETRVASGDGRFSEMFVDFAALPLDPKERENLKQLVALGYEKLTMNVEGVGSWNMESGLLDMEKYRFEIVDAGNLEMNMQIAGYTEELARNIATLAREIEANADETAQQNASMQMLAALTPLAVNHLKISVEDSSLLNKVLDLQAAQLNQEREQLAQFVGPMASVMLAPYNVPEFAAGVTQALNTFMQGNKTITVSAKPENGLVVTEIIALSSGVQAGSVTPADVIKRLDLQVTAE